MKLNISMHEMLTKRWKSRFIGMDFIIASISC